MEPEGSLLYLQEPAAYPVVSDVDTGHVLSLKYVSVFIHLGLGLPSAVLALAFPPKPLMHFSFPQNMPHVDSPESLQYM
jgi:hypothetical protein